MDYLIGIIENTQYGFVTAAVLGLMTAISPCPLATNISAIGFISRDLDDKRKVFLKGLIYTLGRAISYTGLAVIIYLGASQMNISLAFQGWAEKILGPVMVIIGLFMLGVIRIPFPFLEGIGQRMGDKGRGSYWGTLGLGMVFALAFCPYSAVLYFAMLLPLSVASVGGLYLPVVFAIATGLPVILFAWLLAYTIGNVAKLYNAIKSFEIWFRRLVALLFIAIGIYFIAILLI